MHSSGVTVLGLSGHTRLQKFHTSVKFVNFESPEKPDGTCHLALDQLHHLRSQNVY